MEDGEEPGRFIDHGPLAGGRRGNWCVVPEREQLVRTFQAVRIERAGGDGETDHQCTERARGVHFRTAVIRRRPRIFTWVRLWKVGTLSLSLICVTTV